MTHTPHARRILWAFGLAAALALPGCAVVSVAGAVVGTAASVVGTAVSTTVKVTGRVIEKTVDLVTGSDAPPAPPEPAVGAPGR